jgi:hypothetical protein
VQSIDMVLNDVISHHANVTIERPILQASFAIPMREQQVSRQAMVHGVYPRFNRVPKLASPKHTRVEVPKYKFSEEIRLRAVLHVREFRV